MSNLEKLTNNPEIYRPTFKISAMYVGSQAGGPMEASEVVEIDQEGIVGSRYPHNGFYSGKRIPNEDWGVTCISEGGINAANQELAEQNIAPFGMD